jgi:hypothetical protein
MTAEYIQATSRVGRDDNKPGLVVTLLNIHKPRDRSHYERFETYHASFYRAVEATSVTPFSPRAIDRGLPAVTVSLARLGWEQLTALPPRQSRSLAEAAEIDKRPLGYCKGLRPWLGAASQEKCGGDQGTPEINRLLVRSASNPAALQHTWSGHAKSHVSEVYKKLLKQREWRLRWAEKAGTGFTLLGHQQVAAETPNGKSGKILEFRRVG